jgi:hypothetical protein
MSKLFKSQSIIFFLVRYLIEEMLVMQSTFLDTLVTSNIDSYMT